jgi:kynureninase
LRVAELSEYRERFPILAQTTYLISHSLGAMPAAAEERLLDYARAWKTRGVRAWEEGWWELPWTVGDQIGRIIGAPEGSTVMHQNVAVAVGVVLSCFGFEGERRRIVYLEPEFPSVRYQLQAQRPRGADLVPVADGGALLEAIDERTLLVPVSHVLFRTGEIQEVAAIVERARGAGAHVLLDAYQSVGTVPLDVAELGVDFAVGGSVKWLCGGPGAGWLYVRPDLASRLEPTLVGWQAHARPFAFEPELEYAPGATRFLTGTPNVPALYAATAGYDVVEEIGVERIRARSLEQTGLLIELLDEARLELHSPREPERRGGTVVVRASEQVHRALEARDILCDYRPDAGIRIGPHFYNTDDEIRDAAEQIIQLAAPAGAAHT